MGENIIHYYPYNTGFKKSYCGIDLLELSDSTNKLSLVNCKKCLNIMSKNKCNCHSYNNPEKGGNIKESFLQPPFQDKKVDIDACIADDIKKCGMLVLLHIVVVVVIIKKMLL